MRFGPLHPKFWRLFATGEFPDTHPSLTATPGKAGSATPGTDWLEFYRRFAPAVFRVALGRGLGRYDAEEIVQSVFRTFFRRAAQGHYSVPAGEEIWKLLLVIALNKVRTAGAYHRAAKRDMRQTTGGEAFEHAMESEQYRDEGALTVLQMVIDELLDGMPAANRQMIELRIEGYEVAEIAEKVQRSKRTVERVLQGFRSRLEALIHEADSA